MRSRAATSWRCSTWPLRSRAATNWAKPHQLLKGKNFAIVSGGPENGSLREFEQPATELGAKVALIRGDYLRNGGAPVAIRLLGRSTVRLICEGLDPATIGEIDREAGVSVFNGLASEGHPMRVIATLLNLQSRSGRPADSLRVALVSDACPRARRIVAGGDVEVRRRPRDSGAFCRTPGQRRL